ncbi:hypothetical protein FHQ18_00145 [Deferribacter autotrophicus]|uniref:DUF2336 domain-containing protein n=1 Tax=Deferribacter autotrophicus TaxID=500465 RepID=A0A5A8F6Y8_9BACT|nr:hypothetical protein [Deferribacter autotrophicus]KAA0259323.1 hypothetical protein FHQ18_00145 [Deferribacter autotrophicus]
MVESKLDSLISYFSNKDANNLSEKDKLLLLKTLKLPKNELLLRLYEKLKFISTIERELYLKKSTKEQIDLMLSKSIPIDFRRLHIIIYLLVKNYSEFIKNVCAFLRDLSFEQKKEILSSILFDEKEIKVLALYLKDDSDFIRALIEKNKITPETFKILSQSQEPESLFFLSNLNVLLRENPELIDLLLTNPFTPDESVVKLKYLKYEIEELERLKEEDLKEKEENEKDEIKEKDESLKVQELPESFERELEEKVDENLYAKVLRMSVPEKIKLALKGNKSARNILIKDANKQVSLSVLKNPRITEDEIDFITKNKVTPDHVLREIARNSNWVRNYQIVRNLAFNPKTPIDIGLHLLSRLYVKDLENLSKSREVSSVIKSQAYRLFKLKQKK